MPVRVMLLLTSLALLVGCGGDEPVEASTPTSESAAQVSTPAATPADADAPVINTSEVLVASSVQDMVALLEREDWWGEPKTDEPLAVPHLLITAIKPNWQEASKNIPVQQKKALFYRLMLPLVTHANHMVMEFRTGLEKAQEELASDDRVSEQSLALLRRLALLLPGETEEHLAALQQNTPELKGMIDGLLYRVDTVPAGLALGQAAYESGYGTSRFAVQGNSLFGQWTYQGDGIKAKEHRAYKGDYAIKAFDWPFDSVRGYFINLMSHPAYEDFRELRAEMRTRGEPLSSLALADGLLHYSERGQEYVDSLKGMIRHNRLDRADGAVLCDEPVRFLLGAESPEAAEKLRAEIETMRADGKLQELVESMRLD
tara:strand:- start:2371 stop:3489 length:1119 start_codon:yes stop_codon:yes gene_type:complete